MNKNLLVESIFFPEFLEQLSLDILQGCTPRVDAKARLEWTWAQKLLYLKLDTLETRKYYVDAFFCKTRCASSLRPHTLAAYGRTLVA